MKAASTVVLISIFSSTWLTGCDADSDSGSNAAGYAETADGHPTASDSSAEQTLVQSNIGEAVELDWDALIPPEWRPNELLDALNVDDVDDGDPRAIELMEKLKVLWNEAPIVAALDGRRVKLPGFVVPIDWDAKKIGEFLLVPYHGACIHVPPPPANQTVHVIAAEGSEYSGELFDTVWVTGTLRVEAYSSDLADAGYRLEATAITPYDEQP